MAAFTASTPCSICQILQNFAHASTYAYPSASAALLSSQSLGVMGNKKNPMLVKAINMVLNGHGDWHAGGQTDVGVGRRVRVGHRAHRFLQDTLVVGLLRRL